MIRKLINNIEASELIGIVLIIVIAVVYLYYFPNTINRDKTEEIEIILTSKPNFHEGTGDEDVDYLELHAEGFQAKFKIKGCALWLIQKYDILKLNTGDSLRLTIEKKDLIKNTTLVYGIISYKKGEILTLKDYNTCQERSWKRVSKLGIVVVLILLLISFKRFKRIKNNG